MVQRVVHCRDTGTGPQDRVFRENAAQCRRHWRCVLAGNVPDVTASVTDLVWASGRPAGFERYQALSVHAVLEGVT